MFRSRWKTIVVRTPVPSQMVMLQLPDPSGGFCIDTITPHISRRSGHIPSELRANDRPRVVRLQTATRNAGFESSLMDNGHILHRVTAQDSGS